MPIPSVPDQQTCLGAVRARDPRFDGQFYTAVTSTGIYCRPSCPARTPRPENARFYPSAAAAQASGFRPCRRCLPDATPGSPAWDLNADISGRAMRLIADGTVDREGVAGLAARLGYTSRQLGRILTAQLGAGPLALARARRAQVARTLIEGSDISFGEVAFAAGFGSVRQFNQTIQEVFRLSPSQLRSRHHRGHPSSGALSVRLAVRTPFNGPALLDFLGQRAVAGVESVGPDWYARTLSLPHGPGTAILGLRLLAGPGTGMVPVELRLADLRDLAAATERLRRLLDADADPVAVDAALGTDEILAPLVADSPGLRVPGHVDGFEVAVRAVVGQQISLAAARTVLAGLVAEHGRPVDDELRDTHDPRVADLTHLFPEPSALAAVPEETLLMPRRRAVALRALAKAVADGSIVLDRGADRPQVASALLALPGIGPWTVDYLRMRALGDPDALLATDLGTRQAVGSLGRAWQPSRIASAAQRWRPWRSYAQLHLWTLLRRGAS